MSRPSTAREALIVEALGEVARLLEQVESLESSMEVGRVALANASEDLVERLKDFDAGMASIAMRVQASAVDHIIKRTGKAASESLESQARAMNAAARLAFSGQFESNLARLTASLQQVIHRVDRPWDLWLTHAATASVSAAVTWWIMSSHALR